MAKKTIYKALGSEGQSIRGDRLQWSLPKEDGRSWGYDVMLAWVESLIQDTGQDETGDKCE